MRYIYTVKIDNDDAVACPSIVDCKRFINDFQKDNDAIHRFSIYNEETGTNIEIKIKEHNTMEKQELFEKTVKAMDNYAGAIEMELFDFANYYENQFRELCKIIKQKGLQEEFEEFALVIRCYQGG